MFNELVVVHRRGSQGLPALQAEVFSGWFFWKTCLRQIAIGDEHRLSAAQSKGDVVDSDEVLKGFDAYRFILEIICGLHSPLVGETEVSGQFKNAVANFVAPPGPFKAQLQKFFQRLFEDAKRVREIHLKDLGSQSYGSILRRETKDSRRIHVLGAGQLVQEILPWIAKDGKELHVHCRNVVKATHELGLNRTQNQGTCVVHDLSENPSTIAEADVVVIAAPVSARWIEAWLESAKSLELFVDLRAESESERPSLEVSRAMTLQDFFSSLSRNQSAIETRKLGALAEIELIVRERARHVEYRPFGWEDVCA